MSIGKIAAAVVASSALVLGGATPALATDVNVGPGPCSEKDVVIIVPNPVNDDVTRVCFNWPP